MSTPRTHTSANGPLTASGGAGSVDGGVGFTGADVVVEVCWDETGGGGPACPSGTDLVAAWEDVWSVGGPDGVGLARSPVVVGGRTRKGVSLVTAPRMPSASWNTIFQPIDNDPGFAVAGTRRATNAEDPDGRHGVTGGMSSNRATQRSTVTPGDVAARVRVTGSPG